MQRLQIKGVMLDMARVTEKHSYYDKLLPRLAGWGYNTVFAHFTDDEGCAMRFKRRPALATQHAAEREQFGRPLAEFQAVQHLLAEAHVDVTSLAECCHSFFHGSLDAQVAGLVKIRAGRAASRVGERTLQVLGAIGFTAEHRHHRYYRRALTLDVLGGSALELARACGRAAARTGRLSTGAEIGEQSK